MRRKMEEKKERAGDILLRKGKRYIVNADSLGELFVHRIHGNGATKKYGKPQRIWKDGNYRVYIKKATAPSDLHLHTSEDMNHTAAEMD
jgi:hypothetical protein